MFSELEGEGTDAGNRVGGDCPDCEFDEDTRFRDRVTRVTYISRESRESCVF